MLNTCIYLSRCRLFKSSGNYNVPQPYFCSVGPFSRNPRVVYRAPFLNEILGLLVKLWCGSYIHSIHQEPWILFINLEHTLQYFTNNAYSNHREFEIRQIVS